MIETPEWLTALSAEHLAATGTAAKLEQLDYAIGVLVGQALMLQKMFDELRREILAREAKREG